jgi:hypothetical protein
LGRVNEELAGYIKDIVEPTVADFERNPLSIRHAFLACVVAYHASDRAAPNPTILGNLQKDWCMESPEFMVVEFVANHYFKHAQKKPRPSMPGHIPMTRFIGSMGFCSSTLGGRHAMLRNLVFIVRDAVRFLHRKAGKLP